MENEISGGELLDLADVDLKNMGISKVGQRKRILQKVAELKGVRTDKTNTSEDTSLDQGTWFRTTIKYRWSCLTKFRVYVSKKNTLPKFNR